MEVIYLTVRSSRVQCSEVVHGSVTFTENEAIIYTVNSAVKVNEEGRCCSAEKLTKSGC